MKLDSAMYVFCDVLLQDIFRFAVASLSQNRVVHGVTPMVSLSLLNHVFHHGATKARASLESTRTCCFKGIRCDPDDSYNIFVIQSERKDGRLKLMYAPITQSLVTGLQSREEECGYTTIKVLPETKSDIFKYPVMPRSGDVIIYVGTLNSTTFMNRCRTQMIPNKTYCIWYQVEPREWPNASLSPLEDSVCEVWEYTRGNTPKAPLVRYVPPGFLPTEADETTNDQLVMRRAQSMNPATLQWYFIGRLGPIRQKCWDKLQSLKYFRKHELKKIPQGGAKGYPKVYTMEDWRNLGRNLKNVIFLNIHQACNRDQPLETKPLETVRLAQLLSLGFTVISEETNSLDSEFYKDMGGNFVFYVRNPKCIIYIYVCMYVGR